MDANEWFSKAHFFQDPVMPGSLGVDAIAQVVQWYMLETGGRLREGSPIHPRFEAVALDEPTRWKYRGQVVPTDSVVTIEADILEVVETTEGSRTVFAEAWLWVDGHASTACRDSACVCADPQAKRAPPSTCRTVPVT